MKKMIKINIKGREASLSLSDKNKVVIDELKWEDNRDLSEKILVKLDQLLKKNGLLFSDIGSVKFDCDSPYFKKGRKIILDETSSKDKCGFTAWQVGEITAKVLNMMKHNKAGI